METHKVYLVGAGPGGAGLITIKGLEILRQADVIIYDYLVDRTLLESAREGALLICCDRLGKSRYSDGSSIHQDRINSLIIKKAREGKNVVRLKSGDVSIFSRLSQELEALAKAKIEFEIVPGVTAGSAAAALSGIPLTDRRFASSCLFVTGHEDPTKKGSLLDWRSISKGGTIVLYMAVENLRGIVKKLVESGKGETTPAAVVQDAGCLTQKTITGTLGNIAEKARREKITPPAIVIIGKVAGLEKKYDWLKANRRILFTGLSKERFFIKGTYLHLPLIRIEPMADYKEFDSHVRNIRQFDWVVFSSRYGVEYFFRRLKAIGYDARILSGIKIAAIGASTNGVLSEHGITADLVPEEESSKGLIEAFRKRGIKGKRIFLPRSDISDKNLKEGLEKLGATPVTAFAYSNVPAKDLPDIDLNSFDEIVFTSPSGVRSFTKRYGRVPKGVKAAFIGDITKGEAKRCHLLD